MKLFELMKALGEITSNEGFSDIYDIDITGIEMDSRKVKKGNVFVAISGFQTDGHCYIEHAIQKGAVAVLGEAQHPLSLSVPYIRVENSRCVLGTVASTFYNHPSNKHKIIGITGTNGKTTTSHLLKHILEESGRTCSLLGTISYIINGEEYAAKNTTPDSLQLQQLLSKSNDEFVIMEISSHALHQYRVEGVELDYGLFTNLSHEHLDYHQTMEQYFYEKSLLFNYLKKEGKAIINQIGPWGQKMAKTIKERHIPTKTLNKHDQDCFLMDIQLQGKTNFTIKIKENYFKVFLPIPGLHNVYNGALAFLTSLEIGLQPNQIIEAIASFPGVPGRFEIIPHPVGAKFIIDYAHTKDAFEYCLQAAKTQGAKKITHIFGFRGNRDQTKRAGMVEASAAISDFFYLTLDDLNGVPENQMVEELEGLNKTHGRGKGTIICDRTLAIQEAWNHAKEGEWVFITGKGVEKYENPFTLPVSTDKEAVFYLKNQSQRKEII